MQEGGDACCELGLRVCFSAFRDIIARFLCRKKTAGDCITRLDDGIHYLCMGGWIGSTVHGLHAISQRRHRFDDLRQLRRQLTMTWAGRLGRVRTIGAR